MYNLLFFGVPLSSKDFYLTINIIDIIISVFLPSLFQSGLVGPYTSNQSHQSITNILSILLLVFSICALVFYFTKHSYRTGIHKAYMITRIFLTIFQLVMVGMALINELRWHSQYGNFHSDRIPILVFLTVFHALSTFWSFQLMKIIN